MIHNILISPNSFKECISSVKLANIIADEFSDLHNAKIFLKPISDGGDGFLDVCRFHFGGEIINYRISNPYNSLEMDCPVLHNKNLRTVYIESANVLGLKVVPSEYRSPMELSSKGLGELLLQIQADTEIGKISVTKVIIGIGGTATIDMGIGACSVLGLKIYNRNNHIIEPIPKNFRLAERISWNNISFKFNIDIIIDVINPLLGENGALKIFGAQKGASNTDISILENGFTKLVNLLQNNKISDSVNKLYGAGGGIPSLLNLFLNAKIRTSNTFVFDDIGIDELLNKVNILITGEGAYDSQSSFGKGAGLLVKKFAISADKIFLICGTLEENTRMNLPKNIIPIEIGKFFQNKEESIANIKSGVRLACLKIKQNLLL